MEKIESLIADLIQATDAIHLARERQVEAAEALLDACREVEAGERH
jgi:hypothetical protein